MIGTVYNRNIFDRLGDAVRAFKAAPTPAQLYPPQNQVGGPNWITWQGWEALEARGNNNSLDEQRVRKAVQSTSVFANMRAIATEFSAAELLVKERMGDKLENVENHPLELLWEAPNSDMGRSFVMAFWAWSYTMTGKAFLYWISAGGALEQVWPVPPFMIRPLPAGKDFIGGYIFKSDEKAKPILIPRELITYSHSPNLFDIRDGLSFLVAAMTPIESEIAMGFWNRNFFDEGNGIPDGMIALGKDTLDTDVARVRMELRDFFGGTKRGLAIARENDMKYVPWGRSQKDAEFTEGIKLSSTQIGRTMGFPDGYWSESANRANAEQARATMIAGAVWPLLVALHEDMNAGVVRRWYGEQYRAEFKDIRPEDRQLKIAEQESRKTHWTLNELREADGKDPLDDPRGEMLVAEIGKGTPIPATPAAEETEAYVAEQEAALAEEETPLPEEGAEAVPIEETTEEGLPIAEEGGAIPEEMPMKATLLESLGVLERADRTQRAAIISDMMREEDAEWMKMGRTADLDRWERKALKSLRRFHAADVRFESNAIPFAEQVAIHEALKAAETVEDVKAAFAYRVSGTHVARSTEVLEIKADDGDTLLDAEWAAAMEMAKKAGETSE